MKYLRCYFKCFWKLNWRTKMFKLSTFLQIVICSCERSVQSKSHQLRLEEKKVLEAFFVFCNSSLPILLSLTDTNTRKLSHTHSLSHTHTIFDFYSIKNNLYLFYFPGQKSKPHSSMSSSKFFQVCLFVLII